MTKKVYKIKGMHCSSCAMMIEGDLEDIGVNCKCSYAAQTAEVEYDPTKISEEKIKSAITKSGYQLEQK